MARAASARPLFHPALWPMRPPPTSTLSNVWRVSGAPLPVQSIASPRCVRWKRLLARSADSELPQRDSLGAIPHPLRADLAEAVAVMKAP